MVPESILDNRMGSNINLERQKTADFCRFRPLRILDLYQKSNTRQNFYSYIDFDL